VRRAPDARNCSSSRWQRASSAALPSATRGGGGGGPSANSPQCSRRSRSQVRGDSGSRPSCNASQALRAAVAANCRRDGTRFKLFGIRPTVEGLSGSAARSDRYYNVGMGAAVLPTLRLPLLVMSVLGGVLVMTWRLRETSRPMTARKILIPPLGMSTGLLMFVYPPTRIPLGWAALSLAAGALLFSHPLVRSSRLLRDGEVIRLQRSRAFLWILLGLVAVRFAARSYVAAHVSPLQTGSIFFLIALGMIVPWRLLMYREYQKLVLERG
jgi:membrane protein CcdC involved in cytochrome C biogenesis